MHIFWEIDTNLVNYQIDAHQRSTPMLSHIPRGQSAVSTHTCIYLAHCKIYQVKEIQFTVFYID